MVSAPACDFQQNTAPAWSTTRHNSWILCCLSKNLFMASLELGMLKFSQAYAMHYVHKYAICICYLMLFAESCLCHCYVLRLKSNAEFWDSLPTCCPAPRGVTRNKLDMCGAQLTPAISNETTNQPIKESIIFCTYMYFHVFLKIFVWAFRVDIMTNNDKTYVQKMTSRTWNNKKARPSDKKWRTKSFDFPPSVAASTFWI